MPKKQAREIQDYATEFVIEAEIKLGKIIKEMPKHEGAKGQLIGPGIIGSIKMEPPEKDQLPTYAELGINKKDASTWQLMAESGLKLSYGRRPN
jgi:hypothetical protein